MKKFLILFQIVLSFCVHAQEIKKNESNRERILFDFGWKFALGNSIDANKDFNYGKGYFSYFAKTGYGDGAAAENFDDRAWRNLDLPHDWCVELEFDSLGGHSHGYKAIGRNFPENSVGWYRKTFFIDEKDYGKKISVEFDGVHRNSIVWINGFYLGNEHSGYTSFSYDITDYLNYGAENTIAVRVDATMGEGWYYEGAGIYRHVWLAKTFPLHIEQYGTFITTDLIDNAAIINIRTNIINELRQQESGITEFEIEETILDANGNIVKSGLLKNQKLASGLSTKTFTTYKLNNPKLWSLENPYLHKLVTQILYKGKVVDYYETIFGIRTVKFDPNEGFFLNGKNIKIVGNNNHQDHAGVGTAIPDALQEFRIKRLKEMGVNGIRTSHNPATPEMLNICDRIGMLILEENRLMGINEEHFSCLKRMIKRDRNHPSIVLWSLGNEEWAIEGNIKGARITKTMQDYAMLLDSSRAFTTAVSGGWDNGIGTVAQVMGYNYIVQGDIDEHHKNFPWQPSIGTEETNTKQTRGIYETNDQLGYMAPTQRLPENVGTESGWNFYSARPFLSGLFYWTGFDYRGESNPYVWPVVINQSGNIDLCGFPKDYFYYLKAWWAKEPVLHIFPHWNWKGKEGEEINITVFSNCKQVELFLNEVSLGKKNMPFNGHLEWKTKYQPGVLFARGYNDNKEIISAKVQTTGNTEFINLEPDRNTLKADGMDVSVITVSATDVNNLFVPTADNEIRFSLTGPGKIIGVGNGNPSSHEAERYFESIKTQQIVNLKEFAVDNLVNRPEVLPAFKDTGWKFAFKEKHKDWRTYIDTLIVVRGTFDLPEITDEVEVNLYTKSITEEQSIYVNGNLISANIKRDDKDQAFKLDHKILKQGTNVFAVTGKRFRLKHQWDEPNTDPGLVQIIYPAAQWKRKLFNGLAQIIVQSTKVGGKIILTAETDGIKQTVLEIESK